MYDNLTLENVTWHWDASSGVWINNLGDHSLLVPAVRQMKRQPYWTQNRPDYISEIRGGFTDGKGEAFPVPVGFRRVDAGKTLDGQWVWLVFAH